MVTLLAILCPFVPPDPRQYIECEGVLIPVDGATAIAQLVTLLITLAAVVVWTIGGKRRRKTWPPSIRIRHLLDDATAAPAMPWKWN